MFVYLAIIWDVIMAEVEFFRDTDEYKSYSAGDQIYVVGDPDNVLYYVIDGEVNLMFAGHVLETVGKGGIFGEKSLIEENPHTTSATAKTDCRIVKVDERKFLFMVHETPTFALTVMRTMSRRTRKVMELALL